MFKTHTRCAKQWYSEDSTFGFTPPAKQVAQRFKSLHWRHLYLLPDSVTPHPSQDISTSSRSQNRATNICTSCQL